MFGRKKKQERGAKGRSQRTGAADALRPADGEPRASAPGAGEGASGGSNGNAGEGAKTQGGRQETAVFAAGCFWGVQAAFDEAEGVLSTEAGYTGGMLERPSYREVCDGDTGHAEAVRVVYDPDKTSYRALVRRFFEIHDPTQLNRQGADVGHQYRSAIFTQGEAQTETARGMAELEEKSGRQKRPLATEIRPLERWWPAEAYHQHYLARKSGAQCARAPARAGLKERL